MYNLFYMSNMGVQVTIRDVDPNVFREFKSSATKHGIKLGSAITLAMEKFMSTNKREKFTTLKPVSWGKGNEKVSEEIDEILYGE